jgi:DNA-binding Lrp family transcriptional regulator
MILEKEDRLIIEATQEGLPLTLRPYHAIAKQIGIDAEQVMQRLENMICQGVIRRIGAVPNHYKLGYRSNGMSVWDVADEKIDELGLAVAGLEFVSHCYHRPRHLPDWPYNLFAMVHGRENETTENMVQAIADLLGEYNHGHTVLYSEQILKKTGFRLQADTA